MRSNRRQSSVINNSTEHNTSHNNDY
jgi:hypothetical protein